MMGGGAGGSASRSCMARVWPRRDRAPRRECGVAREGADALAATAASASAPAADAAAASEESEEHRQEKEGATANGDSGRGGERGGSPGGEPIPSATLAPLPSAATAAAAQPSEAADTQARSPATPVTLPTEASLKAASAAHADSVARASEADRPRMLLKGVANGTLHLGAPVEVREDLQNLHAADSHLCRLDAASSGVMADALAALGLPPPRSEQDEVPRLLEARGLCLIAVPDSTAVRPPSPAPLARSAWNVGRRPSPHGRSSPTGSSLPSCGCGARTTDSRAGLPSPPSSRSVAAKSASPCGSCEARPSTPSASLRAG